MKGITNYNSIPEYTERAKLPAGAYRVKIIRAEERNGNNNSCALCILFDISEGDFTNYYHEKFNNDKKSYPESAKYKGVVQLWYPNGGEYDESNEKKLKTALERIKQSNSKLSKIDFSKEWDGAALKGCEVGLIFREKEWEYNDKTGFFAEPYGFVTLENLEAGKFKIPSPKYLSGNVPSVSSANSEEYTDLPTDDDLPF